MDISNIEDISIKNNTFQLFKQQMLYFCDSFKMKLLCFITNKDNIKTIYDS